VKIGIDFGFDVVQDFIIFAVVVVVVAKVEFVGIVHGAAHSYRKMALVFV
jgi:hypothetical protein